MHTFYSDSVKGSHMVVTDLSITCTRQRGDCSDEIYPWWSTAVPLQNAVDPC